MAKRFSYYRNLSAKQKRIYDKSDSIESIALPQAARFNLVVSDLSKALAKDDKISTQKSCQRLVSGLSEVFEISPIKVKVLAKRPSRGGGELHGLYVAEEGKPTEITVWMKTAKRKQVVAFKTFLRTLIHEYIHHLDFEFYKLRDSFHTEGFFTRETVLANQLIKLLSQEKK